MALQSLDGIQKQRPIPAGAPPKIASVSKPQTPAAAPKQPVKATGGVATKRPTPATKPLAGGGTTGIGTKPITANAQPGKPISGTGFNTPSQTTKAVSSDSITGATWDLDGARIESDKVYTGNATPFDSLFGAQYWNKSVEAEFGDPRFIVITTRFSYVNGIDSVTREPVSHGDVTERSVWEGDFRYAKRQLVSAKLKRVSNDRRQITTWIKGDQAPSTSFSGFTSKLETNNGGLPVSDPESLRSWVDPVSRLSGGGSGEVISQVAEAYYGNTPFHTSAESETGVRNYQSGKFFADGWWNNPFAPSLV